jgi:hypothetical protein
MRGTDLWVTRLRALVGTGVLAWELGAEQGKQWWIFVLVVWLMGGPIEELIRFLTAGRLQIDIDRDKDEDDDS